MGAVVVPVRFMPLVLVTSAITNVAKGVVNNVAKDVVNTKFARARASQSAVTGRPLKSSSSVASRLSVASEPFAPLDISSPVIGRRSEGGAVVNTKFASTGRPLKSSSSVASRLSATSEPFVLLDTSSPAIGRRGEDGARFTRVGRRDRGIPASAVVLQPQSAPARSSITAPESLTVPTTRTRVRGYGPFSRTDQRKTKTGKKVSFAPQNQHDADTEWGPALLHQAKLDRPSQVALVLRRATSPQSTRSNPPRRYTVGHASQY